MYFERIKQWIELELVELSTFESVGIFPMDEDRLKERRRNVERFKGSNLKI